ncbi:MAG: hypothetical protein ACFFCS_02120 [Candidatus Hodarchaeota archaeon]
MSDRELEIDKSKDEKDKKDKKAFYKSYHASMLIAAMALAGVIGYLVIDNHTKPMISYSCYHFNVQYRVGKEIAMDEVVNNSLIPLLEMYERHPNWKADIEFQAQMIEHMDKMDALGRTPSITLTNGSIVNSTELLRILVAERKQIELIVVQYSDALTMAYPYLSFYQGINYSQKILKQFGLENGTSRAVLLQEGQFFFGFARVLADFPQYDTIMGLREILTYYGVRNPAPIYKWQFGNNYSRSESSVYGEELKILPYWAIPTAEADVIYHNLWFQDGENLNTGRGQTWDAEGAYVETAEEFEANPEKMLNHERRLMELERNGNQFFTVDEWIDYLLGNNPKGENYIREIDQYVPETHWQGFNYRGTWIWMGRGSGSTAYDDGLICRTNYRTHQLLQASEILLNYSRFGVGTINDINYTTSRYNLTEAWADLVDAQVTDTTGLDPRDYEGQHAINKTNFAKGNATIIKDIILANTTALSTAIASNPSQSFQVVPSNFGPIVDWDLDLNQSALTWADIIVTDEGNFINFTLVSDADEGDFSSVLGLEMKNVKAYNVTRHILNTPWDPLIDGMEYYSVRGTFENKDDNSDEEDWNYVNFTGDFNQISYSPSQFENETIKLNRSDYYVDSFDYYGDWSEEYQGPFNFEIYLALSNGLVYSESGNFAIVKNNTASHICGKWNTDDFRFMQTNTRDDTLEWEFFILDPALTIASTGSGLNLTRALLFANLVNTYAPINIGGGALA